jgi:hypothetical protein
MLHSRLDNRNGVFMFHKRCLVLIVLSLSVLLSACAHNEIYRGESGNCISESLGNCENHTIAQYFPNTDKEYHLAFIEFDDVGQLRDRGQMKEVIDTYSTISDSDNIILTIFVHGWHNSAAPGNPNVESFKQLLAQMSHTETLASQQDKRAKRKVLGAYIGWRGDSIALPILNHVTFWERKDTSQHIGLQGGVTEAIVKLHQIVRPTDPNYVRGGNDVFTDTAIIETSKPNPDLNKMAIIGHSFGAQLVYTALQYHALAASFTRGTGDPAILLNPAFEALRFTSIFDLSQENCHREWKGYLPGVIMLTSEADNATRYMFPPSRGLSVLFRSHRDLNRQICTKDGVVKITISESEADRTTIGHFKPYQTHTLTPLQDKNIRKSDFNFHNLKKEWLGQSYGSQIDFEGVKLTHLGRTHPFIPYLNIYVDGSLIKNHGDIWGKEVMGFVHDLIMMVATPALVTSE